MRKTIGFPVLLVAFFVSGCGTSSAIAENKLGVEVWIIGSDIETEQHIATQSLRDAIESAIDHSAAYYLADSNAGEVRVTLPDDVILSSDADAKYVLFEAEIVSAKGASSHKLSGRCRSDEIEKCAADILAAIAPPSR